MSLTMNHDTRYLQSIPGDELCRYIDQCMTRAYAEARSHYREELQEGLERQAKDMEGCAGFRLRIPLPVKAYFCVGEALSNATAERASWVEFTPDQIRAFAHFLCGVRP